MSSEATVYFARWILCGNELIEDGALRVVGTTIDRVGYRTGIKESGDRFVNLGNRILLPGLINLYSALEEAPLRGTIAPHSSHTDFVLSKNSATATIDQSILSQALHLTVNESLFNGITTTVTPTQRLNTDDFSSINGRQILLKELNRNNVHSRFELASQVRKLMGEGAISGATPDRIYALSPQWLKEIQRTLLSDNGLFMMHLGESSDETLAFSEHGGPLYDHLSSNDQWFYGKSNRGGLWYALSNNLIPRGSTVINPSNGGVDELSALAALKTTIAISPRYSEFFDLRPFPLELVDTRKLPLAVITETPAVAKTMNLLDELFAIRKQVASLPALELIKMVTFNPAKALKIAHKRGVIAKGFDADIIAIDIGQFSSDPLEEVISGNGNVGFVMVGGEEILVPSH